MCCRHRSHFSHSLFIVLTACLLLIYIYCDSHGKINGQSNEAHIKYLPFHFPYVKNASFMDFYICLNKLEECTIVERTRIKIHKTRKYIVQ